MDILAKNRFADWLYNRFVENYKKSNISEAFIYFEILSQYQLFAKDIRKLSDQRRHIRELYNTITKALKEKKTHQLFLTGEEGTEVFNREMKAYETQLREQGFSEEYITQSVSDRKMYYYGNS